MEEWTGPDKLEVALDVCLEQVLMLPQDWEWLVLQETNTIDTHRTPTAVIRSQNQQLRKMQ
jgi:hypothetical protein